MNEASAILSQGSSLVINKKLSSKIGLDACLIISELMHKRGNEEGFFYETREEIQENTTLSPYKQREAIQILLKEGFIEKKKIDTSGKMYYRIFDIRMLNFLTYTSEKISHHIDSYIDTNILTSNLNKKLQIKVTNYKEGVTKGETKLLEKNAKNGLYPLTNEEIFHIADIKNVHYREVWKMQENIFQIMEAGGWKPKWGHIMNLVVQNWISMGVDKGRIPEMNEIERTIFDKFQNPKDCHPDILEMFNKYQNRIRETYKGVYDHI
jgi:hypothetical protein